MGTFAWTERAAAGVECIIHKEIKETSSNWIVINERMFVI